MKVVKIIVVYVIFNYFLSCSTSKVRITLSKKPKYGQIAIGFIEDRNTRFSQFTIKNFIDMLQFELMSKGFGISSLSKIKIQESQKKASSAKKSRGRKGKKDDQWENMDDDIESLLPDYIRNISKRMNAQNSNTELPDKHLSSKEIILAAKQADFDFVLQGAISQVESGPFIEVENSVLLFLEIVTQKGKKIGAINFYVKGKFIQEAPYLQEICSEIAAGLAQKLYPK